MGTNLTKERIIKWIDQVISDETNLVDHTPVTCELMVHPGYRCEDEGGCGQSPDSFSKSPAREYEMKLMKDKSLYTLLSCRCNFISYKNVSA